MTTPWQVNISLTVCGERASATLPSAEAHHGEVRQPGLGVGLSRTPATTAAIAGFTCRAADGYTHRVRTRDDVAIEAE